MHSITDILIYARKLKEAGEPENIAEMHAEMLAKVVEANIATKQDVQVLESGIKAEIKTLSSRMDAIDSKLNWLVSLMSVIGIALAVLNVWHMYHPRMHHVILT